MLPPMSSPRVSILSASSLLCLALAGCFTAGSQPDGKDEDTGPGDTDGGDTDTGGGGDSGDDTDSGADSGSDTGVGCGTIAPTATLSTVIPTVFTVTWTTGGAGTSQVEWGYGSADSFRTWPSPEETRDHRVVVAGAASAQEVTWRVRSVVDGEECVSDPQTLVVGSLDTAVMPRVELLQATAGAYTPGFRLMPYSGDKIGVYAFDDAGRVVWFRPVAEGMAPIKVALDVDHAHVLYMLEDADRRDDVGGIVRVALDGSDETFFPLSWNHHGFVQRADGNILYLAADVRTVGGYDVAGDKVVEIDGKGTEVGTLFSVWDEYTCDLDFVLAGDNRFYPNWLDWTHANSINEGDEPDTWLLSLLSPNTIVKIDVNGDVVWNLGGVDEGFPSDWRFVGAEEDLFAHQHNGKAVDGGIMLFDNGAERADVSEAREYRLDDRAMTYTSVWTYSYTDTHAVINGDVQRFTNGNTLVNFGQASRLQEVTPAGSIVWQLYGSGGIFGFGTQVDGFGGPLPR